MKSKKGICLNEKKLSVQFKTKLIADTAFAYLHLIDLNKKVYSINKKFGERPYIYAVWHGHQWGLGLFTKAERAKINLLISKSNDGEIIARVCDHLGFSLIRGSQNRGGDRALREMLLAIENGENIGFTVDGPRGPNQKVKKGLIKLAQLSGAPIIPIVPYTKKKVVFNSWDKCQVPSTIWMKSSLIFGEPVNVPADAEEEQLEEFRLKVENELFELENKLIEEHKEYWRE